MKRIVFGASLIVSLILLQAASAPTAEEKKVSAWREFKDMKQLKAWEVPELDLRWPQIVLLQPTAAQLKELHEDPLAFYKKYNVFGPSDCDYAVAHSEVSLMQPKEKQKDAALVIAAHDSGTYCTYTALEVTKIAAK